MDPGLALRIWESLIWEGTGAENTVGVRDWGKADPEAC
jgi:hypothetical protein